MKNFSAGVEAAEAKTFLKQITINTISVLLTKGFAILYLAIFLLRSRHYNYQKINGKHT